ncbi:MAG: hypothetical protein M3R38_11080 [Actinomycetota bacterium]|nr:hypothetical protein [Actinomycetota bacterium]
MTENTQASGVEYAEEFIGECTTGDCDRPATVRVYEDFVLCALHHMMYEAGEDADEAGIALELMAGWRSVAAMHGNRPLLELFEFAKRELLERKGAADRRQEQLERIDRENVGNTEIRLQMGQLVGKSDQEEAGALPELSAFGRQLVALTGYPGEDLRRLARDMVSTAGGPYEADRENLVPALEARMLSAWGEELPPGFLEALADGLGLSEPERNGLAMAYAFGREPAEPESGAGRSCA